VKPKQIDFVGLLLIGAAVWVALSGGGLPSWTIPGLSKPTAVTYVHDEKAVVPSEVYVALAELNAQGIRATTFPDDASDGDDQVPDQYKVTLPAAKAAGIPSLVVQAGERVLRTVKAPTTKAQVLEAAR
jgi:hypothetical protein